MGTPSLNIWVPSCAVIMVFNGVKYFRDVLCWGVQSYISGVSGNGTPKYEIQRT